MKNKKIFLILIVLGFIAYSFYNYKSKSKSFVVTPNTKIDPNSELAKYVTQEEIDEFGFLYWDIGGDKVQKNEKMENLRLLLKSKNTQEILNYMKDNNISIDEPLHYGVTPLMYASFYNDIQTAKELINLGANLHRYDNFDLNAMAYAISKNSLKMVEFLYEKGLKFEEVGYTKALYTYPISYYNISSVSVDENNSIIIEYENYPYYPYGEIIDKKTGEREFISLFGDEMFKELIENNLYDIAKFILDTGYKPLIFGLEVKKKKQYSKEVYFATYNEQNENPNKFNIDKSLFSKFFNIPNYEPMLNLLLEHNITYEPSKEFLKKKYDECHNNLAVQIYHKQIAVEQYQFERKRYITEKDYDFEINVGLEHCFDKNGTFDGLVEYIKYKNNMNKAKHITYILREKEQTITPKPYRVLSKDEIESLTEEIEEKIRKANELNNKGVTNVSTRK